VVVTLLVPRSRKSRAIPLHLPLWAFEFVTGYLYLSIFKFYIGFGRAALLKNLRELHEKEAVQCGI
jgi:hypothetical protein